MIKYFVIRNFRGTCQSVGMLKGYMVRKRLGTPALEHGFHTWGTCTPNNTFKVINRRKTYVYILFISKYLFMHQ